MDAIQCVGSMLLNLVGLVYGCVVLILENGRHHLHLSSEILSLSQTT